MQETVYRVGGLVCALVVEVPILRQAQDDESGAGASVLDAGVREAPADARSDHPRVERGWAVRSGGASGVGGAGARELDESSTGDGVGAGGRGRGGVAAACARWVSAGRGGRDGVLAP